MANSDENKRRHGRPFDQLTKDGTGSAASVGPGGTGDLDRGLQQSGAGSQQSGGRTDDLLSGGTLGDDDGFRDAAGSGELQTGLGGMGDLARGNRQAATGAGGSMQGERARKDEQEVPRADVRISHKSDRGS